MEYKTIKGEIQKFVAHLNEWITREELATDAWIDTAQQSVVEFVEYILNCLFDRVIMVQKLTVI